MKGPEAHCYHLQIHLSKNLLKDFKYNSYSKAVLDPFAGNKLGYFDIFNSFVLNLIELYKSFKNGLGVILLIVASVMIGPGIPFKCYHKRSQLLHCSNLKTTLQKVSKI